MNREFEVRSVTGLPSRNGFTPRSVLFPNSDEVLLGIETGKGSHAYLIVGGVRYDGNIAPHPFSVRQRSSTFSTTGTILRFQGLKPESLETLQNHFNGLSGGKSVSASCYHGICEQFAANGYALAGKTTLPKRPSEILRRILEEGFIEVASGKAVSYEIYHLGPARLQSIYKHLRARETNYLIPKVYIPMLIAGFSVGGMTLFFLEQRNSTPAQKAPGLAPSPAKPGGP